MKKRYLLGGSILLTVVAYLIYLSFGIFGSYCVTVSDFYERSSEIGDTNIRISGKIADSPVDWNAEDLELKFTITEGGKNMPVVYNGAQPVGLKEGSNLLVEGKYDSDGIFRANQLILKCSSKYESIDIE